MDAKIRDGAAPIILSHDKLMGTIAQNGNAHFPPRPQLRRKKNTKTIRRRALLLLLCPREIARHDVVITNWGTWPSQRSEGAKAERGLSVARKTVISSPPLRSIGGATPIKEVSLFILWKEGRGGHPIRKNLLTKTKIRNVSRFVFVPLRFYHD